MHWQVGATRSAAWSGVPHRRDPDQRTHICVNAREGTPETADYRALVVNSDVRAGDRGSNPATLTSNLKPEAEILTWESTGEAR
jgi:hypothetical protein